MSTGARIRELFREHGRPGGLSLRRLAELALAADVFPREALERAEAALREELAREALFGAVDPWPCPEPPGAAALRRELRELFDRYAVETGIPRRRWRRILEVSGVEIPDTELTWAARRCREALLQADGAGRQTAYPVPEADGRGDVLWKARGDLDREEALAVARRLREAAAEAARRAWTPPGGEIVGSGR